MAVGQYHSGVVYPLLSSIRPVDTCRRDSPSDTSKPSAFTSDIQPYVYIASLPLETPFQEPFKIIFDQMRTFLGLFRVIFIISFILDVVYFPLCTLSPRAKSPKIVFHVIPPNFELNFRAEGVEIRKI